MAALTVTIELVTARWHTAVENMDNYLINTKVVHMYLYRLGTFIINKNLARLVDRVTLYHVLKHV